MGYKYHPRGHAPRKVIHSEFHLQSVLGDPYAVSVHDLQGHQSNIAYRNP